MLKGTIPVKNKVEMFGHGHASTISTFAWGDWRQSRNSNSEQTVTESRFSLDTSGIRSTQPWSSEVNGGWKVRPGLRIKWLPSSLALRSPGFRYCLGDRLFLSRARWNHSLSSYTISLRVTLLRNMTVALAVRGSYNPPNTKGNLYRPILFNGLCRVRISPSEFYLEMEPRSVSKT